MDTTELRNLLTVLRQFGVTEYSRAGITLKLGPAPVREAPAVESQPSQMPRMSEDLAAAMRRLDPQYSDESLFEFSEHQ